MLCSINDVMLMQLILLMGVRLEYFTFDNQNKKESRENNNMEIVTRILTTGSRYSGQFWVTNNANLRNLRK